VTTPPTQTKRTIKTSSQNFATFKRTDDLQDESSKNEELVIGLKRLLVMFEKVEEGTA
jgi:hypothetical protein